MDRTQKKPLPLEPSNDEVTYSNNTEQSVSAVSEEEMDPNSVLLSIKIKEARNIRGSKGEHVSSLFRVQFADYDFKDSSIINDTSNPEFNFIWSQRLYVDETLIDSFWNKKVVFTLIESLPKEKTAILGTAEATLATNFLNYTQRDPEGNPGDPLPPPPLTLYQATLPISYNNIKLLSTVSGASTVATPEFDVEFCISKPILEPSNADGGNFITFKLDDVFPLPEEWTLKEGNEKDLNTNLFNYTINLMLPAHSSVERLISIPMGNLVNKDMPSNIDPSATIQQLIYISKPASDSKEDKENTTTNPSDEPITDTAVSDTEKVVAETISMKAVVWGASYVAWLPPDAVVKMREKVIQKSPLEFEFVREPQARFAHVLDPNVHKYRGKVIVDASCLMFPKVIGLRGRFPMDMYEGQQQAETKDTYAAIADKGKGSSMILNSSEPPKDTKKSSKSQKEESINIYRNLGTTMGLEIILEKPLLDKKKLQPVDKNVRSFIPRRVIPDSLVYCKRNKKADADYRQQIEDIIHKLCFEYQGVLKGMYHEKNQEIGNKIFSKKQDGDDTKQESNGMERFASIGDISDEFLENFVKSSDATEEQKRKKAFLFHLNKSGAYFNFKEQLKTAIVEIVREKFKKKSAFTNKNELHLFMSELYVYLTDQMHNAINKIFQEQSSTIRDTTTDPNIDYLSLKSFADMAEEDGDIFVATGYHRERIVKFEENMQAWFDYGCFCMRNQMLSTGEECFKYILSVNPNHIPTLLSYGSHCTENEKFEEARVYLHYVLDLKPNHAVGNTVLGMYYSMIGEEELSAKYLDAAAQSYTQNEQSQCTNFFETAKVLIHCHASQLCERALIEEVFKVGKGVQIYLLLSKLEQQRGNLVSAENYINEAMKLNEEDSDIRAALGDLFFRKKDWIEAQNVYEAVVLMSNSSSNMPLVYLRLGTIYLHRINSTSTSSSLTKQELYLAKKAKSMFLNSCEVSSNNSINSKAWLGVGKSCIIMNELAWAEDALSEANVLNNRDSEVWANLSLLCLLLNRKFEATQSLAQALRLGIKDPFVLKKVGEAFLEINEGQPSAECFRLCIELLMEEQRVLTSPTPKNNKTEPANNITMPTKLQEMQQQKVSFLKIITEQVKLLLAKSLKNSSYENLISIKKPEQKKEEEEEAVAAYSEDLYSARPAGFAI